MATLTSEQEHWQSIIEDWRQSGLSQTEYCRQHHIKAQQFYSWKSRLKKKLAPNEPEKTGTFLPVVCERSKPGPEPSLRVHCPGAEIEVTHQTDPEENRSMVGRVNMIRPSNSSLKGYVYSEPVDMRKQIDGLTSLVQTEMELKPFSKSLFVFTNKRRDKLKILAWDKNGFLIWYKRLEKQRFPRLHGDHVRSLSVKELNLYLDGYDIDRFKPHDPIKVENVA